MRSLKYPIIQTSYFLKDTDAIAAFRNKRPDIACDSLGMPKKGAWYFPLTAFLELKDNWENDISFDITDALDVAEFRLKWYSEQLYALKEPLIFNQKGKTIYRFTWLRSFNNPVAIRLKKSGNAYILFWKTADGAGGYEPGYLEINKSKQIGQQQGDSFVASLQLMDFWNMPTNSEELGNDGSRWIIEGFDNGKYHVVDRWTPRENNFQKCGVYLIELTDLKIDDKDLY